MPVETRSWYHVRETSSDAEEGIVHPNKAHIYAMLPVAQYDDRHIVSGTTITAEETNKGLAMTRDSSGTTSTTTTSTHFDHTEVHINKARFMPGDLVEHEDMYGTCICKVLETSFVIVGMKEQLSEWDLKDRGIEPSEVDLREQAVHFRGWEVQVRYQVITDRGRKYQLEIDADLRPANKEQQQEFDQGLEETKGQSPIVWQS